MVEKIILFVKAVKHNISDILFSIPDTQEQLINEETFTCDGPSDTSPIADMTYECRLTNGTNLFQVDSGDR